MLISIETHTAYDFPGGSGPPTPSGSAWGDCACAHAHLLSLRCLQMRQVHGCSDDVLFTKLLGDHLFIYPIRRIGLIQKRSLDSCLYKLVFYLTINLLT